MSASTKPRPAGAGMCFGVFLAPHHPLTADPALQLRRDIDLMAYLDHLGFDEAWIGEHHSTGAEIIPAPDVFIAAAAERTTRIRFGTGVTSLPYHHPLITADRILQLDLQTRGRIILGTGPGKIPLDAIMMGIEPAEQRRMQGEAIEGILPLLRGEVVDMETDWFVLRGARCQLLPYSPDGIEVAAASTVSPNGSVLAGKHGISLLSLAASSAAGFDALDRNWAIYEETAATYGHVADRSRWRLTSPMFLAETRQEAERAVSRRITELARYVNVQTGQDPEWGRTADGIVRQWREDDLAGMGRGIIGSPAEAIARIEQLLDKTGGFGTLLILHADIGGWAETRRSFELFASEVIPYFRGSNRSREASLQEAGRRSPELIDKARGAISLARASYEESRA